MSSYYYPFQSSESTFEERVGPPDEVTSGLGHVLVGLSWLEESLDGYICQMVLDPVTMASRLADMAFSKKAALLSELVRLQLPCGKFNTGNEDPNEVWDDFVRMLLNCESFRKDLIGPNLSLSEPTYAKSRPWGPCKLWSHGLTGDDLIDISDYIKMVDNDLSQFTGIPQGLKRKCWIDPVALPQGRDEKTKNQPNTLAVEHSETDLQFYSAARSDRPGADYWGRG